MAEKVTEMLLKVDLDCYSCYKKIKKTLCKFPQIRDQIYDEKNNTVKITVVCCSPEKIRDKLCCKGGSFIKSIEILEPKVVVVTETPEKTQKPRDNGKPNVGVVTETPEKTQKPRDNGKPNVGVVTETLKPQPQKCCGGGCLCCHHGHGMPVAPPPQCYVNICNVNGYPYNNQICHLAWCCDYCLSEENPSSCAIM